MTWRIEYNNDTGPNDEGFAEWWDVTDGTISYRANDEAPATHLCEILNKPEIPAATWRSIKTDPPPKDGTEAIFFHPALINENRPYASLAAVIRVGRRHEWPARPPTHWQPLPPTPRRRHMTDGLVMKYFVLKPAGTDAYAAASRAAMRAYGNRIANENPALRDELWAWAQRETEAARSAGDDI